MEDTQKIIRQHLDEMGYRWVSDVEYKLAMEQYGLDTSMSIELVPDITYDRRLHLLTSTDDVSKDVIDKTAKEILSYVYRVFYYMILQQQFDVSQYHYMRLFAITGGLLAVVHDGYY
jgi:hypothetical protein